MERWENEVEEAAFSNVTPCDGCGGAPARVFCGESRGDDLYLCRRCAAEVRCKEHHTLFDTEKGLKIHRGRMH